MIDRQGVIIYLHHLRQAKSLRKYGHVHYISRKMKYVVLYCNQEEIESVINKVELPTVKKVLPSYRPFETHMKMQNPIKRKNMIIRRDYNFLDLSQNRTVDMMTTLNDK